MDFIRKNFEKKKNLNYLLKKLKSRGWTNLDIGPYHRTPSGVDKTEDGFYLCWDLRGCPPNYNGNYSDHNETLAITLKKEILGEMVGINLREDITNIF